MRLICLFTCLGTSVWLLCSCSTNGNKDGLSAPDTLYAAFDAGQTPWDTLHFSPENRPSEHSIPDTLLKKCLDKATFQYLHFETGEAHFWAGKKYPFVGMLDICLLYNEELWFKKQILLFFDKTKHAFVSAREVANFYGGDGGQVAMESWLFHGPNNIPYLYMKNAEHWLIPEEGKPEPTEHIMESGNLLRWERSELMPLETPDSLQLKKHFRMLHQW